jgi:hypothetical protein
VPAHHSRGGLSYLEVERLITSVLYDIRRSPLARGRAWWPHASSKLAHSFEHGVGDCGGIRVEDDVVVVMSRQKLLVAYPACTLSTVSSPAPSVMLAAAYLALVDPM